MMEWYAEWFVQRSEVFSSLADTLEQAIRSGRLAPGDRLHFGSLDAAIVARAPLSPRLVAIRFDVAGDALWSALYREARPVHYSYLAHELPLWAVQTVYAARPWAFEMPSA